MKEIQYRELISKMNHRYLRRYNERFKTHNTLII